MGNTSALIETPGYFTPPDGPVLAMVHYAPQASSSPRVPVLIAPPLFEERKSSYAALTVLARALAEAGHHVLRFDYRGSGESGGDPAARRWADLAADLAAAVGALAQITGREEFTLLGLRLGATLALEQASQLQPAHVLALAPVLKGKSQARQWRLRSKLRAELTAGDAHKKGDDGAADVIDLDGFSVAATFIEDIAALEMIDDAPTWTCPVDLVQLSFREEPSKETEQARAAWGAKTPALDIRCLRIEAFWDRVDDVDIAPLVALVCERLSLA